MPFCAVECAVTRHAHGMSACQATHAAPCLQLGFSRQSTNNVRHCMGVAALLGEVHATSCVWGAPIMSRGRATSPGMSACQQTQNTAMPCPAPTTALPVITKCHVLIVLASGQHHLCHPWVAAVKGSCRRFLFFRVSLTASYNRRCPASTIMQHRILMTCTDT